MRTHLVLVTSNHPHRYTGGEVMFVEPELAQLARVLGRITVAPQHAVGPAVAVPPGVEIDISLATAWRRGRALACLRAPAWPGFWPEFRRAIAQGGLLGAARVWRWAAVAQVTWAWACTRFEADDAILFYTYWRGGATLALARFSQTREHTAAITRVHRHELYEDAFEPPFQPWHPSMYGTLALTAAISQHGVDYLRKAGVAPERLALHELGTAAAPRAMASSDGVLRIVSCSNAVPVKRVPRIAVVLIALARTHAGQTLQWTHFGGGPELAKVRTLLRDAPRNLTAQLHGAVAHAQVLAHYAAAPVDLFVSLSASEGLPVSVQEAISAAIPVVATEVGGMAELLAGDNGVLLPADPSVPQVVTALAQVLLEPDPIRRQARRDASAALWAERFDAVHNHAVFAQHLKALLDSLQGPHEV